MAPSAPSSPMLRHVAMLPFMAKGHAMPLLHLSRLLLRRGLASAVTFLATPRDAPFIRAAAPAAAAVVELPFPSSTSGPQSMEDLPSDSESSFLDVIADLPGLRLTKADLAPPFDEPEPAGRHWDFILESARAMGSSRGSILNSFHELETFYIDKWNREMPLKMWPVGPLCLAGEPDLTLDSEIAEWLDTRLALNRPVLYVAFGSQADLSRAQLEEIATGLDRSGLDFMWVVRSKWFDEDDGHHQFQAGRFGDRGKVVQGFINQLGVLSHKAIKGFFSHCGWNSVLESISMGVPILAYPMAAEQKLNAKFVVDILQVGIRVWPSKMADSVPGIIELVSSEDMQTLVRELILEDGGKRLAAKANELAAAARAAMETGGSSFKSLELMVREVCEIRRPEAKE